MNNQTSHSSKETPAYHFRRILSAVKDEEEILAQTAAPHELQFGSTAATHPLESLPTLKMTESGLSQGEIQNNDRNVAAISGSAGIDPLADTQPITRKATIAGVAAAAVLPQRVNQSDTGATHVTKSAYRTSTTPSSAEATRPTPRPAAKASVQTAIPAQKQPTPVVNHNRPARSTDRQKVSTCLVRLALLGMLVVAVMIIGVFTFVFYQYYRIASQLPNIDNLRQKAAQFETTRILDRNGEVLYEILDPNAGRRTYVPLEKISPYLVAATIATEDKAFYSHPGFDIWGIGRAFLQNYQSGGIASGASTITQQLARILLFSPEERGEQSYRRKIREAILATEVTRRYTKDEILELYLNEIYFGNLAYGVEAAAETYFGASAETLSPAQAAFLAGLPQAPSVYDIYSNPEAVYNRLEDVLTLMYQASQEQGCIYVSNSPQRVCIDPVMVIDAADEIKNTNFQKYEAQIRYPHWVTYVRSLLEAQYDPQTIYRSGFQVYTTLDPELQDVAQSLVEEQVKSMQEQRATNGALIAMRPSTGEILSMVGSADFFNEEIDGQVNMAVSPRQPGSAIKPLTYVAAFEKGWTPASLLWDVPSQFTPSGLPDDPGPVYEPLNYDGQFHGPVTVREALANSFNVPAVKTLEFVGINDDPNTPVPDGFVNFAKRLGITSFDRDDYGLSLTLGGGDVSLLELTGAYSAFANNGRRIPPVAITKITDFNGNTVYEYKQPQGEQVVRSEHAYLISSILSDNEARRRMFGRNSILNLPFDVAAKTGTTNDFRDNWTLGYTPDLVTGVWVGNADYTPMVNTTGLAGAAPIWSQFMQFANPLVTNDNPTPFSRPGGIMDQVICAISGTAPSKWCPEQRTEVFAVDQPPLPEEQDLWQKSVIDTWTGLLASDACKDFLDDPLVLNVQDSFARKWIRKDPEGKAWAEEMGFPEPVPFAPDRECREDDPHPTLQFISPRDGDTIASNPLDIWVVADATEWFDTVRLEYGIGDDPVEWNLLEERDNPLREPEMIFRWDLTDMEPGIVTLRLYMQSTEDTYAETKIRVNLQVPTPTPTPTDTPVPTPTPTLTPLPTETPLPPTNTPEPTPTMMIFPKATDTPSP